MKPWFLVTFNIILRHIFPENFIEFPQVVQMIWRNSLSILANFCQASRKLTLPGKTTLKKPSLIRVKKKFKKRKNNWTTYSFVILMNLETGKMSSFGLQLNYKFTLCAAEALVNHYYCTNKLFDKDTININPEKFSKYINILMKTIKYVQ